MPAADPRAQAREAAAASLHDVTAAAAAFFAERLAGEGGAAREYLTKRGVSVATAQTFGLGFAPDSRTRLKTALASQAAKRGWSRPGCSSCPRKAATAPPTTDSAAG